MAAMKRKPGRPKKKHSPAYSLGKASSLPGPLWGCWIGHVLASGPTSLWVALVLSRCLCLRITEVLRLRKRDFQWTGKRVHIGALKNQAAVNKSLLGAFLPFLKSLRDNAKSRKRSRNMGVRGQVSFRDCWTWPENDDDFLFPANRADAKDSHRVKDTACKAVARLRKTFKPPKSAFVEAEKIRTHSGRHRMINDLKESNISQQVAMKFARISDVRTFLGYGELTEEQVGRALEHNGNLRAKLQKVYAPGTKIRQAK